MEHIKNYLSLESIARKMTICPACGKPKQGGTEGSPVVCWGECWYGENGLKESYLTTNEWLIANAKK